MSNCTVNIADFRSLHVLKAHRLRDAIQGRAQRRAFDLFAPPLHTNRQRFELAIVDSTDSHVLDIGAVREARNAVKCSNTNRGRHGATVLRFADGASRQNATGIGDVEVMEKSEKSDPLDCPPAA